MSTDEPAGWPPFIEEFILPYVRQPPLWPVLVAILGHVVLVFTLAMLSVWRAPSVKSAIGLGVLVVLTALPMRLEWRATGGLGRLTGVLLATWVGGALIALIALRTGFL